MRTCAKLSLIFLFVLFFSLFTGLQAKAQNLKLYTPYPEITVPPGESIDYSIDLINNSGTAQTADISIVNVPEGWDYDLKSGGWTVGKISVLPSEKKTMSLNIHVPFIVEKGVYEFQIIAGGYDRLPLTIIVSEEGTFKTEFSTKQANMEGAANSTFTFNASLRNSTSEEQVYALRSRAERGWNIVFKANYKQYSNLLDRKSTRLNSSHVAIPYAVFCL